MLNGSDFFDNINWTICPHSHYLSNSTSWCDHARPMVWNDHKLCVVLSLQAPRLIGGHHCLYGVWYTLVLWILVRLISIVFMVSMVRAIWYCAWVMNLKWGLKIKILLKLLDMCAKCDTNFNAFYCPLNREICIWRWWVDDCLLIIYGVRYKF